MQIFVELGCPGTISAHVRSHHTIAHLKSLLLPPHRLHHAYFSFSGKPLHDSCPISACGIPDCGTLQLRIRACGGGGDGGATGAESRDCYLNMYAVKKPDKVDPNEARLAKWSRCALSSESLKPPCSVDLLGNLYNKEVLVSALLTKSLPKELNYIKGLKDILTVHLDSIPGVNSDEDISCTKFQCPISGQEFNGKYKFYALRGCGHVLSAKALKEVQSSACLVCYAPFTETDKIVINGAEDEVLVLRQRMEEEGAKLRARKEKKSKNGLSQGSKVLLSDNVQDKVKEGDRVTEKGEDASTIEKALANGIKRKGNRHEQILAAEKPRDQKLAQFSKRFKAVDNLPQNATKEIYASIFSSSSKNTLKETFTCRSLPLGRN